MSLPPHRTTLITEAVENTAKAVADLITGVSQRSEELISDITPSETNDPTSDAAVIAGARLYSEWLNGSSKVFRTWLDGLALVSERVIRQWTTGPVTLAAGRTPANGQTWLLRVESAVDAWDRNYPAGGFNVYDSGGRAVGDDMLKAVPLDDTWDGTFVVMPRPQPFEPVGATLQVQVVEADGVTPVGAPEDIAVAFVADRTLFDQ